MATEYRIVMTGEGQRVASVHGTIREAVDALRAELGGDGACCLVLGVPGESQVMDGDHADLMDADWSEDGIRVIGYESAERARADRDGAYPDAVIDLVR